MTDPPAYEREYEIEGLADKLVLQIFDPKPHKYGWVCEHKLTGPITGFENRKQIYGDDKLQALSFTLQIIPAELRNISERLGRRVTVLGDPRIPLV